jgi:hypothetical protein
MTGRSLRLVASLALLGLSALATAAAAGEPRTHDGFFLRLSAGFGTARTEIEDASGSLELDGGAGDINLAIGGIVAPNLALHGTLWGWSVTDPDAELTIVGLGTASGEIDGDLSLGAVGAGLTWYGMPANLYLSGSVGVGSLTLDADDVEGESDSGLVLDFTLGKEWWVGDSWGLGLAGGVSYHSLPDETLDENWSGTSFALRFSATYN